MTNERMAKTRGKKNVMLMVKNNIDNIDMKQQVPMTKCVTDLLSASNE